MEKEAYKRTNTQGRLYVSSVKQYFLTPKGEEQLELLHEGMNVLTEPEYSVLKKAAHGATHEEMLFAARWYKSLSPRYLGKARSLTPLRAIEVVEKIIMKGLAE